MGLLLMVWNGGYDGFFKIYEKCFFNWDLLRIIWDNGFCNKVWIDVFCDLKL